MSMQPVEDAILAAIRASGFRINDTIMESVSELLVTIEREDEAMQDREVTDALHDDTTNDEEE
jgi:hypothetical protein